MSKIILLLVFLFPFVSQALTLAEIANNFSVFEGIYTLKSGDIKKCSSGRVIWIEDPEDKSLSLQVGARIIILDINGGPKTEKVQNCTFNNKADFLDGKLDFESSVKCAKSTAFRKTELIFDKTSGKEEIQYKEFKKQKRKDNYILDYECIIEKTTTP